MRNYKQGIYEVQNRNKYVGTKNPRYLSSYELAVFKEFDTNPNIIEWGSETTIVPYYNKIKKKMCRYLVDIYCKYQDKNGNIIKELVEIKPSNEVCKPRQSQNMKRSTNQYQTAVYITNMSKWTAAAKYAKDRGMQFRIITERNIL